MNILIITAHYPAYDVEDRKGRTTPFLQHYAKEWASIGHEVVILHLMRSYPKPFYWVSKIVAFLGSQQLEKYVVSQKELEEKTYNYEGVRIHRIIYKKYIPHSVTSSFFINKIVKELGVILDEKKPDIVIGDCFDPVLQVMSKTKKHIKISYVQIVHNSDFALINNRKIKAAIRQVDGWLLRSNAQRKMIGQVVGNDYRYTLMYSGIEGFRVKEVNTPRDSIKKLLFVGALQKPKGLDTILEAMNKTNNNDLSLTVIGNGIDEQYFKDKAHKLGINNKVSFVGAKPHDEVFKYMEEADALVLISHETFGMVYVEAMSQGCIPIGAKNEGIDGVVIDGVNGYLCALGNVFQLSNLFDYFSTIEPETVKRISNLAYKQARQMTNNILAKETLSFCEELC